MFPHAQATRYSLLFTFAARPTRFSLRPQCRNFFGLGEILGVLTNPAETVRSLAESRKLLEEARQEMRETRERAQTRPTHTFSPLPGFFPRPAELRAVESSLEGIPTFTILFGASSVGKTALLREVLSREKYHVLHFDLRIAGFADLGSLYFSLVAQMQQYWETLMRDVPGYKEWEKEAWLFKHDRLDVERRLADGRDMIKTSDIARLMEIFQSSLLKYWEFQPSGQNLEQDPPAQRARRSEPSSSAQGPNKKIPVIFIDEAHKLPALIQSRDAMKCILDAFLVLTKQDRLCHVVHATSDPFYQTWLRQLNVMQHCKIISLGDCSKEETHAFFLDRLLPSVSNPLRASLDFEELYRYFGGKLVHWNDYITDYVNADGKLSVRMSSHFLQAHALLNLQLLHSRPNPMDSSDSHHRKFEIYSPLALPERSKAEPERAPSFKAEDLLLVMRRLTTSFSLPYFLLCRELGADVVDGMVQGRILELRWSPAVTTEGDPTLRTCKDDRDALGPRLFATTPIIAFAMQEVLKEYESG
ncbi:hypothetical protein K439DRAFT_1383161 [Ramaria rubella]|nr:hypothetical protein K439DRAFT_1383161 [Ramaria rubella]